MGHAAARGPLGRACEHDEGVQGGHDPHIPLLGLLLGQPVGWQRSPRVLEQGVEAPKAGNAPQHRVPVGSGLSRHDKEGPMDV